MREKSTVEEIRARFDNDVGRFSNLETGQSATIDAALVLDLVTTSAARVTPDARRVLDIGCGAGNYSIKLARHLSGIEVDLIDLSQPMLDRAVERVGHATSGSVRAIQGDIRDLELGTERYDIVLAAAVLHHLREDDEWSAVFRSIRKALRPGGTFWISDLVAHDHTGVHDVMWTRYGAYLSALRDDEYRDHVFEYIALEDSPRSVLYQIEHLRAAGFAWVEVLHKNGPFAALGAGV
ncbi:MAG: class I SAM-dependent methyltransferase [Bacteroidota bacterium]